MDLDCKHRLVEARGTSRIETTAMRNPEPGGGCERSMSMSKTNLQMTRRVAVFDDGCMRGRAMLGFQGGSHMSSERKEWRWGFADLRR